MSVHVLFDYTPLYLDSAYIPLNNYLLFNDVDGLYTCTFEAERKVSLSHFSCLNNHSYYSLFLSVM